VNENSDLAALDKLKTRIQGLRAKTTDNGCTEDEALSAANKVAELLVTTAGGLDMAEQTRPRPST
jgi:hypothetical protein